MHLGNHVTNRTIASAAASLLVATGILASLAVPAQAHGIIELNGKQAYAGKTSVFTLEIQHGCLANEGGTTKVMVFFTAAFKNVKPQHVKGWKSTVVASRNGRHAIVWTTKGAAQTFNVPLYLPTKVTWPRHAGVYGIPVKQFCSGGTSMEWTTPSAPATADAPSPPLYPLPEVQVK